MGYFFAGGYFECLYFERKMLIDIVIVNWNAGFLLRECVDSVLKYGNGQVDRLIVVDNGSTDGSIDLLDELSGVDVIRTGDNLGFAAACNLGAEQGHSPYILFLNPDTRIESTSLSMPLAFMEQPENDGIGICGIQLVNEQGAVSRTCAHFPTMSRLLASSLGLVKFPGLRGSGMLMNDWDHKTSRIVDQVIGAFFFIRRSVFQSVGGFDERFFVYYEEVDLSLKVKQTGLDSWYLAETQAFHAGGGSSSKVKAHRLFYSMRSRILYGFKNFPLYHAWLLVGVTIIVEPLTRMTWCTVSGDMAGVKNTWSAYRMLLKYMAKILKDGVR
jgi:GT2 family glycosyltransferase